MTEGTALPGAFAEIADDFHALTGRDRLQLLLEFANGLPALPERYAEHPELLEPVPECQSPIFLITEVEGGGREATARLFFSAPPEAPTTRGFAGILSEGGVSVATVEQTVIATSTGAAAGSPDHLHDEEGGVARLVIGTHTAREQDLSDTVDRLAASGVVERVVSVLRVEGE